MTKIEGVKRSRLSKEERREQILQAACSLFARQGYETTTNKDIAEAIGVGERLIFHYFSSKDSIFREIFSRWAEGLKVVRRFNIINYSAIDTLRLYMENMLNEKGFDELFSDTQMDLYTKAVRNRQNYENERHVAVSQGADIVSTAIMPVVIYGQQNGEIREGDPLELSSLFFASLVGIKDLHRQFGGIFKVPRLDLCLDILRKERGI